MDEETGLYYYGARYYNPRESVWLSTDPLSGYNPVMEVEHYIDGQHNGGVYNSFNHNTYGYCYQNPVIYVDPNGKQTKITDKWNQLNDKEKNIIRWHPQWYRVTYIEKNANEAFKMTEETFNKQGKGDESDAFRHAFWQARNTQDVGEELTRAWSDAHEYSTPPHEVNTDLYMDIHNNDVGIEIGKSNPKATPEELKSIILDKISKGELLILNEDQTKIRKSDGSGIKNSKSEIRKYDVSHKIATEILKNPQQKTKDYE